MDETSKLTDSFIEGFIKDVTIRPYISVVQHYAMELSSLLSDRNTALRVVHAQPIYMQLLSEAFKNDEKFAETALNYNNLKNLRDESDKKKAEFISHDSNTNTKPFKELSVEVAELVTAYEIQKQKSVVAFEFIGEAFKADKALILKYVEFIPVIIRNSAEAIKNDKDIILKAVGYGHQGSIGEASHALQNDFVFLKEVVSANSECLLHLQLKWKETPELLKIALKNNWNPAFLATRLYSNLRNDNYIETIKDLLSDKSILLIPKMISETSGMDSVPSLSFSSFVPSLNKKSEDYFIRSLREIEISEQDTFKHSDLLYYVISKLEKKHLVDFVSTHSNLNEAIQDRLHSLNVKAISKKTFNNKIEKQRKTLK